MSANVKTVLLHLLRGKATNAKKMNATFKSAMESHRSMFSLASSIVAIPNTPAGNMLFSVKNKFKALAISVQPSKIFKYFRSLIILLHL